MKRYLIIIIMFAIISVGSTAVLINIKNNSNLKISEVESEINNEIENKVDNENVITAKTVSNNNKPKEKTLDLYGVHDENDLIFETKYMDYSGNDITDKKKIEEMQNGNKKPIEYIEISGLKDKKVENKVNSKIKEKIYNKSKEILDIPGITEYTFYCNVQSSFSNILSISFNIYAYRGEKEKRESFDTFIGLNFELINGDELKFEDLFITEMDISEIPRIALYRRLAEIEMRGGFRNIYYDSDKQIWLGTNTRENNGDYNIKTEYVPYMTDYEIEKKVKKFINSDERVFYFTPSRIIMDLNEHNGYVNFVDISDDVVIYDKYITKDSLYERNDIGFKGKINCSAEINYGKYKETKYKTDNLFYDIDVKFDKYNNISSGNGVLKNYLNNISKDEADKLKEEIKKYEEISTKNPNKAYFVFLETIINDSGSSNPNNLIVMERKSNVITCDMQNKKEILDDVLSAYRYYNIGMYGSIYEILHSHTGGDYGATSGEDQLGKFVKNREQHYYNIYNGKEIKEVKDLFAEGFDYEQYFKSLVGNQDLQYEFSFSGITIESSIDNRYIRDVKYDQLQPYTIVKEISEYILQDSSTKKYEKSELEKFNKDELTIAYNELFAKYGHDFQTKYLKDYFSNWDWYKPVAKKSVGIEALNEVEKYNVQLIKEVMNEK